MLYGKNAKSGLPGLHVQLQKWQIDSRYMVPQEEALGAMVAL